MSSDGAAEVIYNLQLGVIQNYCLIASSAFVIYEHVTTFSQEVDLIWSRKRTGATIIFILNRWLTIGMAVAMILLIFDWRTNTELLFVVWAGFSALRIYAIGGKDWKLALVAFALALAPVCTNLVSDIRMTYSVLFLPPIGNVCNDIPRISPAMNIICTTTSIFKLGALAYMTLRNYSAGANSHMPDCV
ncbi:hypothetical protein AcW1_008546 [Taiwanofungus camphoratus]|nr:hypothetical protein AcW1_008546 [Antrodia cinnamomea]KAI0956411.1 hypothetical protein AcV7_006826 [Antrodia cinnamomea]